jgi:hypothetical protein
VPFSLSAKSITHGRHIGWLHFENDVTAEGERCLMSAVIDKDVQMC